MKVENAIKWVKARAKTYKQPILTWPEFFKVDMDGYQGLPAPELYVALAERKAGFRKILLATARLGEVVNEAEEAKPQGLDPYQAGDIQDLLITISSRMRVFPRSPFWECAGLTPDEYTKVLKIIRSAFVKHPLNAMKAYAAALSKAENWRDALTITFYFSQAMSMLAMELAGKEGITEKMITKARMAGVMKI